MAAINVVEGDMVEGEVEVVEDHDQYVATDKVLVV